MKTEFKIELAYQQSKELTINQLLDAIDETKISNLNPKIMDIRRELKVLKYSVEHKGGLQRVRNSQLIIKMLEGEQ